MNLGAGTPSSASTAIDAGACRAARGLKPTFCTQALKDLKPRRRITHRHSSQANGPTKARSRWELVRLGPRRTPSSGRPVTVICFGGTDDCQPARLDVVSPNPRLSEGFALTAWRPVLGDYRPAPLEVSLDRPDAAESPPSGTERMRDLGRSQIPGPAVGTTATSPPPVSLGHGEQHPLPPPTGPQTLRREYHQRTLQQRRK
jgi:hypothetical protein